MSYRSTQFPYGEHKWDFYFQNPELDSIKRKEEQEKMLQLSSDDRSQSDNRGHDSTS